MNSIPHLAAIIDARGRAGPTAVADYARDFFASHQPSGADGAMPIRFEGFGGVNLPLVDREEVYRALPAEAAHRLKQQERCLLGMVAKVKEVPSGETIVANYCSALGEAYGLCPPGTVVVIRKTDVATVAFLYPHLRVDFATGAVAEVDNPLRPPAPAVARAAAQSATRGADDVPEWVHYGLSTAGTLAFALPEPFGVIGSALLNLIDMLLPKSQEDPFKPYQEFLDKREWEVWINQSKGLTRWIVKTNENLVAGNPLPTTVEKEFLDPLQQNLEPGGKSLFDTLNLAANTEHFIDKIDQFYAFISCASTYLFGIKYKLVLCAYCASEAHKVDDDKLFNEWNDRWRTVYRDWVLETIGDANYEGWATRISRMIQERETARMAKITPPKRTDIHSVDYPPPFSTPDPTPIITDIHMWEWRDDETGEYHRYDDYTDSYQTTNYEGKARSEHDAHVAQVAGELDRLYKNAQTIVGRWRDAINEWNENLPPGKPQGMPTIDLSQSRPVTDQDGPWANPDNDHVSYAVSFYNDRSTNVRNKHNGPGTLSEWVTMQLDGKCCPALINIPVDTFQQAMGRRIYRKLGNHPERLIGLIADNTTTIYHDTDVRRE